jgi:hypothetical protein
MLEAYNFGLVISGKYMSPTVHDSTHEWSPCWRKMPGLGIIWSAPFRQRPERSLCRQTQLSQRHFLCLLLSFYVLTPLWNYGKNGFCLYAFRTENCSRGKVINIPLRTKIKESDNNFDFLYLCFLAPSSLVSSYINSLLAFNIMKTLASLSWLHPLNNERQSYLSSEGSWPLQHWSPGHKYAALVLAPRQSANLAIEDSLKSTLSLICSMAGRTSFW